MKSHIFLFLWILSAFLTLACSDSQEDKTPHLTIEQKTVNFAETASSSDIQIKTNDGHWTATVQGDAGTWLKTQCRGFLLQISVSANEEMEKRHGEIKVTAGKLSEIIVVEQLGMAPALLLSPDMFTVAAGGGEVSLEVTANVEYDISIPADATWIKPMADTRAAGMVKKAYRFSVSFNAGEAERATGLVVKQKDGTLEKRVAVRQKAQSGYTGESNGDIKDDVKVPVSRATASSFQQGDGIEKSFDGDYNSIYHSSWSNQGDHYFPITLEYFFENQESIDYLIYYPRTEGYNGHFKEVEIWASTQAAPNYAKVKEYDFKGSSLAAKVMLDKPLIKPLSVKFVVKSGHGDGQGFASCAEMEFYRRNPDNFDPLTLFTDLTCSELKPGISLEEIEKVPNSLYRNIAYYLHKGSYPHEFRIQNYRAWPHPDDWARVNKTSTLSLLDNPTGISVDESDELIVFVGPTGGYKLGLKVQNLNKPGGDGYGNASHYSLSEGVNKLKMRNRGLVYVFYHTPDYQSAPQVKIHFATGKVNGYFDSQKHQASDWQKYLHAAVDEYFDVLGKHAHLTFSTAHFKTYAANNGKQLIDAYDELVRLEKEFMGLMKYNRPTVNRAYFHAMYHAYFYSTSYRTAYNVTGENERRTLLDVNELKKSPWGPAHEQGHSFQTRPGFKWHGMTEVTNNVHSLYVQTEWGNASRIESEAMGRFNNRYEKAYYNSFVKHVPHPGEEDVFCKLVSLWQLQLYFSNARGKTDFYKDLYEKIRTSPDRPDPGAQQLEFVKMVCDIAQADLTDFFRKWGYLSPFDGEIDDYGKRRFLLEQNRIDKAVAEIKAKNYPSAGEKIEYICDSNWKVFKDRLPVRQGTAVKSGKTITMTGWQNVAAYEVYDGDTPVFVSNRPSFSLDTEAGSGIKVMAVAYDGSKTEVKF